MEETLAKLLKRRPVYAASRISQGRKSSSAASHNSKANNINNLQPLDYRALAKLFLFRALGSAWPHWTMFATACDMAKATAGSAFKAADNLYQLQGSDSQDSARVHRTPVHRLRDSASANEHDRIPNLQNGFCREWILLMADSLPARRQSLRNESL